LLLRINVLERIRPSCSRTASASAAIAGVQGAGDAGSRPGIVR